MKRILILSLALCAANLSAKELTAAPTGTQYMIEAKVLSVAAGSLGSNDMAITADSLTMSTNGQWNTGGRVDAAGALLARLEKTTGIDVLSAPKVVTLAGQEATIQIVREIAYMVPETNALYRVRHHWLSEDSVEAISNGLYRMQALDENLNPGISLTITTTAASGDAIRTDVKFRYNLLVEMSRLPGTKIATGEPVIESRMINTTVVSAPGNWIALGGMQKVRREDDNREENILVFLRVTEAKNEHSGSIGAPKQDSQ